MPIGTQVNTDTFNRANENPLVGNWTSTTGSAQLQIASNIIICTNVGATDCYSIYNAWASGNDQYSQVEVTVTGTSAGSGPGVCVRHSTTIGTETMYRVVMDGAGNIELSKIIATVFTSLATRTVTYVATTKLGLAITGNTLSIWYGGVQQGATVSDSAIASGTPGLGYSSAITTFSMDNWDAGTTGAAAPSTSGNFLAFM